MMRLMLIVLGLISVISPSTALAQEITQDTITYQKAVVLEVLEGEIRPIPGLGVTEYRQSIRAQLLDGMAEGDVVLIENDYLRLEKGDVFFAMHIQNELEGADYYSVADPYRLPYLIVLGILFLVLLLLFGGLSGMRGLVSLLAGLYLITGILLPGVLKGDSPLLLSLLVSGLIVTLGSYITHGFRKTTSAAIVAMLVVVAVSGALAYWITHAAKLTGFSDESAIYLNFNTGGIIDFQGLLLGSILIGLLGVLYDIAIGQSVTVEELMIANPDLSRRKLYQRALRIGREHIGALVNTLAIAYVGVSLPLLLLFSSSDFSLLITLNREVFAAEIARILIGSIGLVLATPVATIIAVLMLKR